MEGTAGRDWGGPASPKGGCPPSPQVASLLPSGCTGPFLGSPGESGVFQALLSPCLCPARSVNYRFSAADRWARMGGGIGSQTLSFSLVRVPLQRGESRNFLRKVRSGLSRPQHEHNDRCILQRAEAECARPRLLLSAKSLFFVIC